MLGIYVNPLPRLSGARPPGSVDVRWSVKRAMDVVGALFLLLLLAPVFFLLVFVVSADGGPPFFVHRRVGRNGNEFGCLKFRTMRIEADRAIAEILTTDPAARVEWEATRKLRHDPRVTPVGHMLRGTSLDELPQLVNVLRGDMSLVGPRPVVREELDSFYVAAGAAADYLAVRPGITGPWQVGGRNDTTYVERIESDVRYVRNPSLRTDLLILARTPSAVLRRHGVY